MRNIAPSQCTNPSHASIFTGLYPKHHGVFDNQTLLAEEAVTLAEILREHGYATVGAVSARHLNPNNSNFGQGFDAFLPSESVELRAAERNVDLFRVIESLAGKPFFAWVHYFDPHGDYAPPDEYATTHAPRSEFDPIAGRETMDLSPEKEQGLVDPDEIIALYKGEITYMDAEIGELLGLLSRLRLTHETLVVLVADHGESMTEKEIYFCHAGMYNQVLHVPMIFRFSPKIPAGTTIRSVTSSVDILPTILDLLDFPTPPGIDGHSLVPALDAPDTLIHEWIVGESVNGVIRTVLQGGYKFIKPYTEDWSVREKQLYRVWEDYGETVDLIDLGMDVETAERLEAWLDAWVEDEEGRLPSRRRDELDPATIEALKSLGYIN
jgi:arylsulfatase A-like enzyme